MKDTRLYKKGCCGMLRSGQYRNADRKAIRKTNRSLKKRAKTKAWRQLLQELKDEV